MAKRRASWGTRIINPALLGGVTLDTEGRIQRILDEIRPGSALVPDGEDTYSSIEGDEVSIEHESNRTLEMQERLDYEITFENHGVTIVRDGRPPCLRTGMERQQPSRRER